MTRRAIPARLNPLVPEPIRRSADPRYDAAVRLVALAGEFVNRHDLPEFLPGEEPVDLVRRWRRERRFLSDPAGTVPESQSNPKETR